MNKKLKFAIPFAVLAISCGVAAGCKGCNEHEHSYTEWGYNETQHWKECPDDHEKDESSIGNHKFEAGECECGAKEPSKPVVEDKYGKVKITISLCKLGTLVNDFKQIKVDLGDDDVEVGAVSEQGVCEISNVKVGNQYTVKVSKPGYEGVNTLIQLEEENEVADVSVRLEYTAFSNTSSKWAGWYPTFYHTEEGKHTFSPNDNTVTVHSIEKFNDVAATLMVKRANSTNRQGVWLFFEDGGMCPVYISSANTVKFDTKNDYGSWGDNGNLTGGLGVETVTNLFTDENVRDKDGKKNCTSATLDLDKCEEGTLPLTLVRRENKIYVFVDGKFADMRVLDAKYATQQVRVGFYSMDCKKNESVWEYSYTDDVSEYLADVKPQVALTDGIADTVCTATLDKEKYAYGDTLTLTVDLKNAEGYYIESIKVDGKDYQLNEEGKLTLRVDSAYDISVSVYAKANVTLNPDVKVKKDGAESALADGTDVVISGALLAEDLTVKVAEGKISAQLLPGEYTFAAEGYVSANAYVKADGAVEGGKIVLGYKLATIVSHPDKVDLSGMNDQNATYKINSADADTFDFWGGAVPEIKLELNEKISNSVDGTLTFNLKAERPNGSPNNAFGLVLAEGYEGVALSFWDVSNANDGIAVHGLVGQKLGTDGWGDDKEGTFKWLETAIYSANGADFQVIRKDGTITIQAKNGEEWVTIYTVDAVDDSVLTDIRFMGVGSNFTISNVNVDFKERVIVKLDSAEIAVDGAEGFVVDGTELTFQYGDQTWTGTVTDGKVVIGSASDKVTSGRHRVFVNFGGYQFKAGYASIDEEGKGEVTINFTGTGIEYEGSTSAANPSTGELTFKLGNDDDGAYNNKYDIVTIENGGYFAQKIEFTDIDNKQLSLSLILRVKTADGVEKEIKQVIQNAGVYFGEKGKFYWHLDDDSLGGNNSVFNGANAIDLSEYNEDIKAGRLWFILGYDAETGSLVSYVGTDLQNMLPVKTWGKLPAGLKVTGFGVGNWLGAGGNSDTAKLTVKYGETMEDIGMGLEDKIDVTTAVADDETGTVTANSEDFYRGEECVLTVTAGLGYQLKSIKIGNGEALLEGWTQKGRVYTYKFKVTADTTSVLVTFEELPTVATAEITVTAADGYVAEGASLTFECLDLFWTGTVADGKVTIGTDKRVTVGTHNVYVDFGGYKISIGTADIEENGAGSAYLDFRGTLDATGTIVTAKPTTGELTINLGSTNANGWNNKYDIIDIEDGGYFAQKVYFHDLGDNKRSLSIGFRVEMANGTTKEIKQVIQNANRFFGEDGKFYMHLDDDNLGGGNSVFQGGAINLSQYNDDIKAGNLWLVLGYDAKTGGLVTYAGTDPQKLRPIKTWGSIPKGLKVVDIIVGNWFNDENNAYGGVDDKATITMKYGKTLEDMGMSLIGKIDLDLELTGNLEIPDGTQFTFIDESNGKTVFTYGEDDKLSLIPGKYKVVCEGYATRNITVDYDSTTVSILMALPIANALDYVTNDAGDNWGMGEFNFKDLIDITENDIKINASSVNGKKMNGFCRWGMNVPEATLRLSDDVKYSTEVTLEFNLKAANSNESPNNAFGIVMAAGYKGVNMSIWSANEQLAYYALTRNMLGNNAFTADNNTHDAWLKEAIYGENGANVRAVRSGASIKFYAQYEGEWIQFFETTCDESAQTDIKFLGIGSDFTVSQIKVTAPTDKKVTTEASVNDDALGEIEFENPVYYIGQTAKVIVTVVDGYELEKLVIGTTEITEGWTQAGNVFTYSFTVEGNVKVTATIRQMPSVAVTFKVTARDYDGTALTLENGTEVKFDLVRGGTTYTYEVGGETNPDKMAIGEYTVTAAGFCDATATVTREGGRISVILYKPFATASDSAITVTADKTIAIKGNGVADRNAHRAISADLKMTEEQINSTGLTLEFTAKVTKKYRNGDDWAASRFGIQMGEGAVGFFVFIRDNGTNNADVVKLNANLLDLNPNSEKKWHGNDPDINWLTIAALSEEGVQMKVVRVNGVIHIYAKNGENWVLLDTQEKTNGEGNTSGGDLTIANTVKNQIKFLATGDDWLFSNVKVTLPEASEKVTCTANVNNEDMGSVKVDHNGYYKGDKAVLTVTVNKGYELEKLTVGETEITQGWTQNGTVYTYVLELTESKTVNVVLKETPKPTVNITVTAKDTDGTTAITPSNGTVIKLTSVDGVNTYTYTVGGTENPTEMAIGTYNVTCYGYADTTATVLEGGDKVEIALAKVIAYASTGKSDHVTVNNADGKITIEGNGFYDRENGEGAGIAPNQKANADFVIPEELRGETDITLTFTVKRTAAATLNNDNNWVARRFGVQLGEGAYGFYMFIREGEGNLDIAQFVGSSISINPDKEGNPEQKWINHDTQQDGTDDCKSIWNAIMGEQSEGLQMRMVRSGGKITVEAFIAESWLKLGEIAVEDTVENQIKFVAGGDTWEFSAISVTETVTQTTPTDPTTPDEGGEQTPAE